MISGPIIIQVLEGENVINLYRELMGATNPANAEKNTIRKEFGISVEENSILHKPLGSDLELKNNFLPSGKINVGITSGASTPDKVVADVIEKLIAIAS